ncbi:hypothetical protein BJ875DRAFT_15490 [Amylocarpus encephaloides]|uniref:AHC1-like C2H2 zinc-finger domain-containing protein n=1 Tax=Amylocarpus encephaloides TaxID=45428 RepID=A0A9P7YJ26_9HELO|nr:hypothetical protein BJ875DRAFT_15490 [Amylocarpus encephaloides]
MFRLSSWISESRGCDKVLNGNVDKMANAIYPVVEVLPGRLSKRKRESSLDAPGGTEPSITTIHEAKRRKLNTLIDETVGHPMDTESQASEKITVAAPPSASRLQETIETQLGLEILLKHKELRLINQELAKCQVALEQLRRCHLIPYPTSQGTSESMLNVVNGTGAALKRKDVMPEWAPPYGVTDGPYARHYSKWLIPDPSFDGEQEEWHGSSDGSRAPKTVLEGRATRYSFAEGSTPASKSRSQRGNAGQKLQALSSGYPQAKEKAGPCVLKRGDGQMVKLVCLDCKRENFSSTQGFINHCRIAHRRDFKSHEEAAVASGQAIEFDEGGGIVGEEKSPTVATGLVHPLIRLAPADKEAYVALLSRIDASMELYRQGKLPGVTSIPTSVPTTPVAKVNSTPTALQNNMFIPSSDTPNLSNFMRSRGFDGNLDEIVGDATKPFGEEDLSSHDEESEQEDQRTKQASAPSPLSTMRTPARVAMSPAPFGRPMSSKGVEVQNARVPSGTSTCPSHALPVVSSRPVVPLPRPSTYLMNIQTPTHVAMPRPQQDDVDMDMTRGPSIHDLSPNTVASNNAPSLVSDDGEFEDGDDVESVTSHEEEGSDVAEIDIEDGGANVLPRTVMRNRDGSGGLGKEDKHVTFVSPMKDSGRERRKK